MRCAAVLEALPGYAGGDLLPATTAAVREHLRDCRGCSAELSSQQRVVSGLAILAGMELEPPADLHESIVRRVDAPLVSRLYPVVPLPPAELVRIASEHRDAIASAAGAAVVVAGTAWTLWQLARRARRTSPASS